MVAALKSEWVAAFKSEYPAGFVGIRTLFQPDTLLTSASYQVDPTCVK
jgi:hypothetical protein